MIVDNLEWTEGPRGVDSCSRYMKKKGYISAIGGHRKRYMVVWKSRG